MRAQLAEREAALRTADQSTIPTEVPQGAVPTGAEPSSHLVTRDAVGRKIETTLEEIEDLLATAIPSQPQK